MLRRLGGSDCQILLNRLARTLQLRRSTAETQVAKSLLLKSTSAHSICKHFSVRSIRTFIGSSASTPSVLTGQTRQLADSSLRPACLHRGFGHSLSETNTAVQSCRLYGTVCKLKPKFRGGKLKLSGAYKRRFKRLSNDSIKLFPAGHRHRRFRKSKKQLNRLKTPNTMHHTYANTMKRMGFK